MRASGFFWARSHAYVDMYFSFPPLLLRAFKTHFSKGINRGLASKFQHVERGRKSVLENSVFSLERENYIRSSFRLVLPLLERESGSFSLKVDEP